MTISIHEEYAELMKHNSDGHYLYKPQPFSELYPGAIGYFDHDGEWTRITDISDPVLLEGKGLTRLDRTLTRKEPEESLWKTRSSGSEAEASFGLTGGLSGALSAAPVDVSANAKNKWGKTGKAALITDQVVVHEAFAGSYRTPMDRWIQKNAKALLQSEEWGEDIKEFGICAIQKTWSTQECAITMESAHSRDTSAGLDVGATGVGKFGGSGSSLAKTNTQGWSSYKAKESQKALVVTYGGPIYKLHSVQFFRSKPLKQVQQKAAEQVVKTIEYSKPVYDENGKVIGFEEFRPVLDENGKQIGEKKIDREAEEKQREEERKRREEEKLEEEKQMEEEPQIEEEISIDFGAVGMTDSDDEAEAEAAREEEEKRKELAKKVALIMQNPDQEQKRTELAELFKENIVQNTIVETTIKDNE